MLDIRNMIQWEWIRAQLMELSFISIFVRLLLAALLGGLVGVDRGRRRRAAGMRTHMLVCIGAALVMITNQYIVELGMGAGDMGRMGAQVISGIGFLGAGTILVDRNKQVRGLTTAAGLWACACMGLALGVGFFMGAILACAFILATIIIFNRLERIIFSRSRTMEVYAEFEDPSLINPFVNTLAGNSVRVLHLEVVQPRNLQPDDKRSAAILTLRLPKRNSHTSVLEAMSCVTGLLLIEELYA